MKRVLSLILATGLAGCATMGDAKLLVPVAKLAVVEVTSNPKIYYVGDKPPEFNLVEGTLNVASNAGAKNDLVNTLNERPDVALDKAEALLLSAIEGAHGPQLVGKKALFDSDAYKSTGDMGVQNLMVLHPAGYKLVKFGNASLSEALKKDLGVDASLIGNFLFQKDLRLGLAGTGSLGALVTLNIQVLDSTGKLFFTKSYVGRSKGETGVVAHVYDPSKFQDLVIEAATAAINAFASDLSR